MILTRRSFVGAAAAGLCAIPGCTTARPAARPRSARFDPWVEVVADHLRHNVGEIGRLTGGAGILAVVKNNAYGLGLVRAARLLEPMEPVAGFAVVKTDAALALRDAGIAKPILLMGMCSPDEGHELVARGVQLSLYTPDAGARVAALARRAGLPIEAQAYLDTGLGRMGMPYHAAWPWLAELARRDDLRLRGAFTAFTEEPGFDPVQLRRFAMLTETAADAGLELGALHAASSNGVFHLPDAHLGLVRPGIALYGSYPSRPDEERRLAALRPALRLRCRVARVVQLRAGDSAGYGRKYVARAPTWLATLPAGHADGVPRDAVRGAVARIGDRSYPIVGSVSASHCLVELGAERAAAVGDVATLVGPDHDAITPDAIARVTGVSVYDVLMRLGEALPRVVVPA